MCHLLVCAISHPATRDKVLAELGHRALATDPLGRLGALLALLALLAALGAVARRAARRAAAATAAAAAALGLG